MFCVQCGQENPEAGTFCWSCGRKLFKAGIQRQTPDVESSTKSRAGPPATRRGKKLVIPIGATLPEMCVKCGAAGMSHSYKFAWIDPAYFALFFLGILPYFVIRLFLRKTVRLLVPLCERHQRQTRALAWASAITLLTAIPAGYGLYVGFGEPDGGTWGFFFAFFLIVVALVLLWAHYPLRAVQIDKKASVFRGANEDFLKLLPPMTAPNR
jgi:hypothetical protein